MAVASGGSLRFYAAYLPAPGSNTRVDGTLQPLGPLTLAGTLAGGGVVNGSVVVTSNGVLAPGGGYGTLTTGNLTVENGATYRWETSAAAGPDLVDVNGALSLGTATLTVDLRVGSGAVPSRVELFEYTTLASVPSASQFELTAGYTFTGVGTTGNRVALTGVANDGHLFADDFETGDTSSW